MFAQRYREQFPDIHIGYSGHEIGYIPTLGAVALGSKGSKLFSNNSSRSFIIDDNSHPYNECVYASFTHHSL